MWVGLCCVFCQLVLSSLLFQGWLCNLVTLLESK